MKRFLTFLTALLAFGLTLAAWRLAVVQEQSFARQRFDLRVEEITNALRGRMLDYEQVLRGVAGVFALGKVDTATWAAYTRTVRVQGTYPGIQALGFAEWRDGAAVVRFIEPDHEINRRSLGFDMYSEARRRDAMERARAMDGAALSGGVVLRQETGDQMGVLLYYPVYRGDALAGFVYSAFRIGDLLQATLGETPGIALRLLDVTDSPAVVLHDDGTPRALVEATRSTPIGMRGRIWRLEAGSLPGWGAGDRPRIVLAGGLAISLLLTLLVWLLLNTREHARELARRMLAASEELERFRLAVDRHPDTMVMVDAQAMRIVYVNEGGCRNLGYTRDELIGRAPGIVFADRDEERLAREYASLAGETGVSIERGLFARKDGSRVPVEVSRQVFRGRDRTFVLGIARDITERLAAERAVRESEQRLTLAIESSGLALFDWDVRTGLVHLGDQWPVILGEPAGPTVTPIQKLEALVHPADLPALREQVRRLVRNESSGYRIEHRVRTRSGEWKWIESVAKVNERDATGRAVRVTGTNADITARKAMAQMKNDFIASVSHELRTPLTGIVASLGLLQEGAAGELPAEARTFVDMAHANSERLAELISDLLDLEGVESGRMRLEMQAVEVGALLRQSAELNQAYAERHQARIEVRPPAGELAASADPRRLSQVLSNLISNAAKFSPPGGRILLTAYREPGSVTLAVSDQGPGIPEEFRARLFGKFEQADPAKPGTGLGLAICKAIVERMGGAIRCESEPGRGATFLVELREPA
ncbi:MAG TPA: PAS domain S-box protein [Burkholderiales bacterium]|nr:PAS domain S-box protein [Burkholderiales bacterium]